MRLILFFFLGFIIFFYIGAILDKLLKHRTYSITGLLIIFAGFIIGFFGHTYFIPPLNILLAVFLLGSGVGLTLHHLLSRRYLLHQRIEHTFIRKHESLFDRSLEILPGALTWTALSSPFWLALVAPYALAYFILLADVYWLTNAIKTAVLLFVGYGRIKKANSTNWLNKLEQDFKGQWEDHYHLFVLPTYNEPFEVVIPAVEAATKLKYPKDKIFFAVGFEERSMKNDPDRVPKITEYINKHISSKLAGVFTSIHPPGLEGEIPGPATNRNWMVKNALKELKKRGINPEQVIVTTLDADFVVHEQFLGGLMHKYLSTPPEIREKRSYTGSFLYTNNYWQAPTPMRLIATGTVFWQLTEMVASDKYMNFSSLSINMKSLLDIGLWIPNKVNDDSGFYWKAYFHFQGDYKVIPHYILITADAVQDVNLWKTFVTQYQQLKRWAYGVEHIPYIVKEYFKRTDIDFWNKTDRLLFVIWGNLRWGFLAIFVTFGGSLLTFLNPQYSQSVLAVNLPIISSWILTAAFIGLFATIYVNEKTAPPRPKNWSWLNHIWSYMQWLLVPVVMITITTIPAIHAQTSLMLGKYLEFRTTTKTREKD